MSTWRKEKENDPSLGRLKRLGSIASITTPIGQIASKFRRPSTSHQSSASSGTQTAPKKPSFIPRSNRENSKGSSEGQYKDTDASTALLSKAKPAAKVPASKLPKSRTMSTLPLLSSREPPYKPLPNSYSSTTLEKQSGIPGPLATKHQNTNTQQNTREFSALRKISGSALPRFSTQPNLFSSHANKKNKSEVTVNPQGISDPIEAPLRRRVDLVDHSLFLRGWDQAPAIGASFEERKEIWQSRNASEQTSSQQQTPTKKITKSRKSVDEVYEELQSSTGSRTPRAARSDISGRPSLGGSIRHHQLLTPLTPPLPRLSTGLTQPQSPYPSQSAQSVRQVRRSQPPSYWSGRYTSINDRLMNDAIDACPHSSNPFFSGEGSQKEDELARLTGAANTLAHAQRILDMLYAACTTEEALRSLRHWHTSFGLLRQMPELAAYRPKTSESSLAPRASDTIRNGTFLRPLSGNAYGGLWEGPYSDEQYGSDLTQLAMLVSEKTVLSSPEIELLSGGVRGRKTSFMDRLLSSGGKVGGRARAFGKSGAVQG